MSTTSTTELRPIRLDSTPEDQPVDWQTSTAEPSDPDNVIQASLAYDATVPDGGYGWVVVCCCSVLTFWFVGTTYSWGVIQSALVHDKLGSPATLSLIGSLSMACVAIFAILNTLLIRAIGTRALGILGVVLISTGQVLSGFTVQSVPGLFITNGVVLGIGCSFCFTVVSTMPAQYFNKKRGTANGIVFAGGGLGGAVISFIMNGLLEKLGAAWTFRVLGFIAFATAMPAAWLIRERAPLTRRTLFEWRLFLDPKFVVIFLAGALATFPIVVPPFFLPLYATSLGLTPTTGTALVAAFNFSSAAGRILCGLMGDRFGPLNTLFASLLLSAISMLALWPVSSTLAPLVGFAIVNGASNGGFFAIMPTVAASVFGSARLGVAMGMIVTGWTGGYLMGAPIAGYILEAYGGQEAGFKAFRPAIYYAGSIALGAAALVGVAKGAVSRRVLQRV